MCTLNYKALLIKTAFIIFVRAIGVYLLLTLPSLAAITEIYMISASYAISFGWVAGLLFLLFVYAVQKMHASLLLKKSLLYAAVFMAVLIAFQLLEITGVQYKIWQSGFCLLFPAAAVIAGWISLFVSRKNVLLLLQKSKQYEHLYMPENS